VNKYILFFIAAWLITVAGCREVQVPKPKGYFRIDLPAKEYVSFAGDSPKKLPLTFEYPVYGRLSFNGEEFSEPGWFNLEFPVFHAKLHLTYRQVNDDLESLMEETYRLNVKNHIVKAEAIDEQLINYPEKKVYGIFYDLRGNTATSVQFYVTDSINHYLRGSLYFSAEPNADSIAPVRNFLRADIMHMIETLRWKDNVK
jgi:gliding motility-associated lipoprotein GldD